MTLSHRDVEATVLTALAVLVYAATREGWNVPLVGNSHRWAAGAILLLGMGTCARGTMTRGVFSAILAVLGVAAFVFAVGALWTGALGWTTMLIVVVVLLWLGATTRHAAHGRPLAT